MDRSKYKEKTGILNDSSRVVFAIPEVLLKMINMWPLSHNWMTKMAFFFKLTVIVCIEMGQLVYFVFNISDITKITSTMSTLSTTLQAIVKMSVMYIYSNRLKKIINIAYNDFWPADSMGAKIQKDLKALTVLMVSSMYSLLVSALIFAFGFLTKPLIQGSRLLPFDSWYPFNWQVSPLYEIIYVIQVFSNIYIIITSILGHDFFVIALSSNVIAQYKLLKEVMKKLGSGRDKEMNEVLLDFEGIDKTVKNGEDDEEKMLMVKCIVHHNKLLMVSDEMRQIFTCSFFVQLATSVAAICVSSFLITMVEIDTTQLYHLTSYCLGHVLQLFMICAAGNELSYQSETLGDYAFNSDWHLKKYTDLKKSLIMVIMRCQRGSKLTAFGIFDLNYNTFIAVMRMSFSFYTLLSSMTEKKDALI